MLEFLFTFGVTFGAMLLVLYGAFPFARRHLVRRYRVDHPSGQTTQ